MDYSLLNNINNIEDLKKVEEQDLPLLCDEIRSFMIESVLRTGGHLASSLGAVELIVAIHYVFDSPVDKVLFDVGHQAYAHKILTGRKASFATLRSENGISGFPRRTESEHDVFNTGHASTAISAAVGFARSMRLKGETGKVVALVGDGAMTGGMSFEAMDDAGNDKLPLIIVLNDNEMSIAKNVGGLMKSFSSMRTGRLYNTIKRNMIHSLEMSRFGKWLGKHLGNTKNRIKNFLLPNLPFEDLGFTYIGPVDGHDIGKLIRYLKRVRDMNKPVILHALTKKGKGFEPAEKDPESFHGISPDKSDKKNSPCSPSCSETFGHALTELAEKDNRIVAITAAMPKGTGLSDFAIRFRDRFFDVGIAEEHAVTMAAAFAANGMRPVVAIYSSFLQRSYDQLLHDVCLQHLPVVIAVDRAGFVGEDGETHQGIYDPGFLLSIPNLVLYSPASLSELKEMLAMALSRSEPAVIRYNRGTLPDLPITHEIEFGKWEVIKPVDSVTVFATGTMLELAKKIAEEFGTGLVHMRFFRPFDQSVLDECRRINAKMLVIEENVAAISKDIALYCENCIVRSVAVPNTAVAPGSIEQQRNRFGLNKNGIAAAIKELEEL